MGKCLQDPKSEVRLKSIGEKGSERKEEMIKPTLSTEQPWAAKSGVTI